MENIITLLTTALSKEIIVALITALAAAAFALIKKMWKQKKAKDLEIKKQKQLDHKREIMEGLNSYVTATEDLRDLCKTIDASRAVLIQLHNGGHRPELGRILKATIVAEWAMSDHELIAGDWQGLVLDADYIISVVKPLVEEEAFYLDTSTMRSGCKLRDRYVAAGIAGSKIILVGVSEETESTFIISCHFDQKQGHPQMDEQFRVACRNKSHSISHKLDLIN